MAAKTKTAKTTTTVAASDRNVTFRGREFPASVVTCSCRGCEGRSVLVPAMTVEAVSSDTARHNFVAQSRLLGFPEASR